MKQAVTRWGVAGTGDIARQTLPDLRLAENVEVLAVSSRSQANAERFATDFGVPRAFGDFRELLADDEVDVVYICTPPGAHLSMVEQAIEAGKHVLCEKPLTINAAQARRLAALAVREKVFLMEAMWTKFNPTIIALQEAIAAGSIGAVRHIQGGFGFVAPASNWLWSVEQGGGALLDVGVYPITLAHLFMGRPQSLLASGSIRQDGIDAHAMVTLTGGDAIAQVAASLDHVIAPTASVAGDSGYIVIGPPFWRPASFQVFPENAREPTTVPFELEGAGYVPMFRATSSAILAGAIESAIHPLSATIDVLEVIDHVRSKLLDVEYPDRPRPFLPWEEGAGSSPA